MITTVEEAMQWFLTHSSGSIVCQRPDGQQKECSSYPEAKEFLESK